MSHDLLTRRKLLKGLGAAALCSPFISQQAWAVDHPELWSHVLCDQYTCFALTCEL